MDVEQTWINATSVHQLCANPYWLRWLDKQKLVCRDNKGVEDEALLVACRAVVFRRWGQGFLKISATCRTLAQNHHWL